jgi:hypothetical protein
MEAFEHYEKVHAKLNESNDVVAGQMFGKRCLKTNGKAFLALHNENIIFKLSGAEHKAAINLEGAELWDPSGKGRPMKEWISLPVSKSGKFLRLAKCAMTYVLKDDKKDNK